MSGKLHTYLHTYNGGCHCQNLRLRLESDKTPQTLGTRADGCSFCQKHHALYTSDPEGRVHLVVRDAKALQRYRFGTKTADFLICKICGGFVAALMEENGAIWSVVNINALEARAAFLANPLQIANFEGETLQERLARRKRRWTPAGSFIVENL